MNVPLLQRETHVLNLCSDPLINVSYKLCATNVIRRTFRRRGIPHRICEGVLRASER